jgi:Zn-dependent peptidase ImmA (M78 family)
MGAVERAAQSERARIGNPAPKAPVDIFRIAKSKRIQVRGIASKSSCPEGVLIPSRGGYEVRLRVLVTEARRRFSLAHELGHTFFYSDEGNGPRHQIGILNVTERAAEERICDLFAGALLMPELELREDLENLPVGCPSAFLACLDAIASRFQVSLPALVLRLGSLELHAPEYLLVLMRSKSNSKTRKNPALRVENCVALGSMRKWHIWRNITAQKAGLHSASTLYEQWERLSASGNAKGCFVFGPNAGIVPADRDLLDIQETVQISRVDQGKWASGRHDMLSSVRLYSWGNAKAREAYVISACSLGLAAPKRTEPSPSPKSRPVPRHNSVS